MNQYTRESKGKHSIKPDFITWLLTVKPFQRLRVTVQFVGYVLIGMCTALCGMIFGVVERTIQLNPLNPLDPTEFNTGFPVITWFLLGVFAYCTIDYYLEYRKL